MASSRSRTGLIVFALAIPGSVVAQSASAPPVIDTPPCNAYHIANDETLSAKQRTCIWGGNLLTPGAVFGAAVSSAYGILTDDEPSWGQGSAGFARRYAARYTQGVTKDTGQYLTALLLHEDPRRKPSNCISWKRTVCAARSLFAQPKADGSGYRPVFQYLAGAAAGGFVGISFYPDSGTVNESLRRSGTSLASSLLSVEITEFEPDILRIVGRMFSPKSTARQAGASSPATKD
jgi:hypothetical protein